MKKQIKVFLILLALVLASCSLVACSTTGKNTENNGKIHYISDYETEAELYKMNWLYDFGKVNINTDEKYVKSGKASAYMEVHGNPMDGASFKPSTVIYTNTAYNDKSDYTDTKQFNLSVFNDSDRDISIYFQFKSSSFNKSGFSSEQKFTLTKGVWNDLVIEFDRGFMKEFIDIDQISEFWLKFDNRLKEQTPAKIYVDRFVAVLTDEPIPSNVKVREDKELESANRSEYLSAWVTSNGASLQLNTDAKYIVEGAGSFKWSASALSSTSWPRIDFLGNTLKDISGFESIYFWIFNANPDDYDLFIAGATKCGRAIAGEWTLIEMKTAWLSGVMDFYGKENAFDIKNFTNFNMVVTNEKKDLTFYIDSFYARSAGDELIGKPSQAAPIILSDTKGISMIDSGLEVTIPTITNASDYESVEWKVAFATQPAGSTSYGMNYLPDLKNCVSFTPTAGQNNFYTIYYTAKDSQGRRARAEYSYATKSKGEGIDFGNMSTTIGGTQSEPMKAFKPTVKVPADVYTMPNVTKSTDAKYLLFGEDVAKITFPITSDAKKYAITWNPDFNVEQYKGLVFYFYNDTDSDKIVQMIWGLNVLLPAHKWISYSANSSNIVAWANAGAPEVHNAKRLSMTFDFGMQKPIAEESIYIKFGMWGKGAPIIELNNTEVFSKVGQTHTVEVPYGSPATWTVKKNGVAVPTLDNAKSILLELGKYEIEYSQLINGEQGTATTTIYVDDETKNVAFNVSNWDNGMADGRGKPTSYALNTDKKMFGNNSMLVTGTKTGNDISFIWNTGDASDISELVFYIYNESSGDINYIYGAGSLQILKANSWTRISIAGTYLNAATAYWKEDGLGSQVKRDTTTKKWSIFMPMNVSKATGDYKLYINALLYK